MILGNGLIAKVYKGFNFHKNILIFASGVSNSKEFRKKEFARERDLLIENLDKKKKLFTSVLLALKKAQLLIIICNIN